MIVLAVALPLLAAFLLPISGPLRRVLGPAALLAMAGLALAAWGQAWHTPFPIAIGGFQAPLGIVFHIDGTGVLFTLLVALACLLLWPCSADNTQEQSLTLILAAGCAGLALSGDLFNIYVFYELVAVASYGLAAARGTAAGWAASFRYLVQSSAGSLLALLGIAIVYFRTGTLNLAHLAEAAPILLFDPVGIASFAFILLGLGVKAELFPVNSWAPEVYATAHSRVSALLAGVVSKLAVLVLVRTLVLVFPFQEAHMVMLTLGTLGVLAGELAAWRARDMKRMLAWSSIGQLGMVFIAFSIPDTIGLLAGLALALHHLLVKPAFFLLAEHWGGGLERMAGAAKASPLGAALFALFALSLIGVPPLPGFWAKYLLLSGLAAQGATPWLLAGGVVLLATIVEASYLFRFIARLYAPGEAATAQGRYALAATGLLGAVLLAATLGTASIGQALAHLANQTADRVAYIERVLPAVEYLP